MSPLPPMSPAPVQLSVTDDGSRQSTLRAPPHSIQQPIVAFHSSSSSVGQHSQQQWPSDTRLLQASPYPEPEHLLDLDSLDTPNRLLAQALVTLDANDDNYAVSPYADALNWSHAMSRLKVLANDAGFVWRRRVFYVVEFRSKLKPDIDGTRLFELDKQSHREATQSGGLLQYWYGVPDGERRNLATCLWRSKEDAIAGGKGPWHRKARAVINEMYETITIKGLQLVIDDNVEAWAFLPLR